jgi:DUF1680 family protein
MASGFVRQRPAWNDDNLYREVEAAGAKPAQLTFIPYFAWGNRGDSEMTVWLPAAWR